MVEIGEGFKKDKIMDLNELKEYAQGRNFKNFEKELKTIENNTECIFEGFHKYRVSFLNIDFLNAFVERYKNIEKLHNFSELHIENLMVSRLMNEGQSMVSKETCIERISLKNIIKDCFVMKDFFLIANEGKNMKDFFTKENSLMSEEYERKMLMDAREKKSEKKQLLSVFFEALDNQKIFVDDDWEKMVAYDYLLGFPNEGVYNWAYSGKISETNLDKYVSAFLVKHSGSNIGYAKDLFEMVSEKGFREPFGVTSNAYKGANANVYSIKSMEDVEHYEEIITTIRNERREAQLWDLMKKNSIERKKDNKIKI